MWGDFDDYLFFLYTFHATITWEEWSSDTILSWSANIPISNNTWVSLHLVVAQFLQDTLGFMDIYKKSYNYEEFE